MSKGQDIIDGVIAGFQSGLGITPEQHLRWCLNRISDLEADLNRERMETHRLRELVRAADLHHIRLRAGLREALAIAETHAPPAIKDAPTNRGTLVRAQLAELRLLVTP